MGVVVVLPWPMGLVVVVVFCQGSVSLRAHIKTKSSRHSEKGGRESDETNLNKFCDARMPFNGTIPLTAAKLNG